MDYRPRFNLTDHNQDQTVLVSTVSLMLPHLGGQYETCIFTPKGSDVVERYENATDAAHGHVRHCNAYGITVSLYEQGTEQ